MAAAVENLDDPAFGQFGHDDGFVQHRQVECGINHTGQVALFIEYRITERKTRFVCTIAGLILSDGQIPDPQDSPQMGPARQIDRVFATEGAGNQITIRFDQSKV